MKLYAHQEKFISRNPDRALLLWEFGLGKSIAGALWVKKREDRKALIVCPKAIVGKWGRELEKCGATADVVSRDQVKKMDISAYRALVIDEAQDFASPLFSSGRSQRATKIYTHIKNHPDTHALLLTATPIRSSPWNCHTLACYLRVFWPIKAFRDEFYYLTDMFGRMHWEPRKDWRKKIRPYLESIADIVLMSECADVPLQSQEVRKVAWTAVQDNELGGQYLEPAKEWHARHRLEQGDAKFKELQGILDGHRKVVVVCFYLSQIEDYRKRIGEDRQVFTMTGSTDDQDAVIRDAQEADDCVLIVQASLCSGFDLDTFSVMVFASLSFSYVHYVQMSGRINRIHNLHENLYIHLLGGKADEAVYKAIMSGRDFDPIAYLADNP